MKLIAQFELALLNTQELDALYNRVFNELVKSESESYERRNALASLENIQRELRSRDCF